MSFEEDALKICCVGDISLAYCNKRDNIVDDEVGRCIKGCDISIANMEYVVYDGYIRPHDVCLVESTDTVSVIKNSGINVVSLANNHILDYGADAIISTRETLNNHGIAYCGAGLNDEEAKSPVIINRKGKKVAIFGRVFDDSFVNIAPILATRDTPGAALLTSEDIEICSARYRSQVDYMIMFVHWGMQQMNNHTKKMHLYGQKLLDGGFDFVFGSHAHVIEGVSSRIYFGLGNFYFAPIPYQGSLDGLLYGPRYRRNRISEMAMIHLGREGVVNSSVKVLYQDTDDVVKCLSERKTNYLKKKIYSSWADYSWLHFQGELRVRIIGQWYHSFKVALERKKIRGVAYCLSKGIVNMVLRIIVPKTLG